MTIEKVPGTDLSYYLIAFHADGRERTDDPDGKMTAVACKALAAGDATDVFLMSHGWKGDIPAARVQYNNWIGAMMECKRDIARIEQSRPGFQPVIVGFHWPSQPWGDEEFGIDVGGAFASTVSSRAGKSVHQQLVDAYAERLGDTPTVRLALETIMSAAAEDIAPAIMPETVRDAYLALDHELGLGSEGAGGAPGDDRERFDPERAYRRARDLEPENFGAGGLGGLLSPLRQLSFWRMKGRARRLGETAGFELLRSLQQAVPAGRDVRFHLMGHSFGCIVVSAMLRGQQGLPHPVYSLTLVQGALSLWSYCSDIPKAAGARGYFRPIVEQEVVAGPIITTQSKFDTAVGRFYPLGAGAVQQVEYGNQPGSVSPASLPKYGGLGSFGIQGPGLDIVALRMRSIEEAYEFEPGKIYNLECSQFIREGSGASGAHSDIARPEVAHAMWSAVCR